MSEPGWYNAQGDPPGTQRYWDGAEWIGDPVYEPSTVPGATAAPQYPPPTAGGYSVSGHTSSFPGSLKPLAIILSILKAIPLVLGIGVVLLFAVLANEFDDSYGSEYNLDVFLNAAIVFIIIFLLIGATLLGFQFFGAIKERPMMILVPAILMSILDGLAAAGSWVDVLDGGQGSSPGGAVLITAVAAAQITVAVQAFRANQS